MTHHPHPDIEKIATLDFDPVLEPEPKWKDHVSNWLMGQKLTWVIVSKTKDQLVEHVAKMDDGTYIYVLRVLKDAALKGQADKDMADAASARIMAASAVLAMQETAGKRTRS